MYEEDVEELCRLEVRTNDLQRLLDPSDTQLEIEKLQNAMLEPGFWADQASSGTALRRRARLENILKLEAEIRKQLDDIRTLIELAREDAAARSDLGSFVKEMSIFVDRAEAGVLLSGPNDQKNAIMNIHAGAGGVDAQDWAQMLMRMYIRWAERHAFEPSVLEVQDGQRAGIKSATISFTGEYAYGNLLPEAGVHRLVRISPFDFPQRRHTSFASVAVYPETDDEIEIIIDERDLRIDTFRSTGKGGQHVNTTDSAVRITHLPTNIVVQSHSQRSQHKNRKTCMVVLRTRLYELELEKKRAKSQAEADSRLDIRFGSQIRSYVLQPYQLVKDMRTKVEIGDVNRVLNGDIDALTKAYLMMRAQSSQGLSPNGNGILQSMAES